MQWETLKDRNHFVPSFAKSVEHEPRNGISLCDLHHGAFDAYSFFIRWVPSMSLNSEVIGGFTTINSTVSLYS